MLTPSAVTFLKRLLDTPGPSGYEAAAAKVWRDEASTFAAEVTADVHGNSMAVVNPGGSPTIMLAGHIDEIGVIVTYIDDEGYVHIGPIGGWDPQVLVAQRIRFQGRTGEVIGAVGKKPIHLMKPDDREKASKMTDLWVDIGATSRAEAEAVLAIGDAGVIDQRTIDLPNDRIISRSIDDRIGAFVVLEALRRYAAAPGAARVVAVATTQEEIAYMGGGARVAGEAVGPAMAIVVDVTFATDHPGIEKKELGHSPRERSRADARLRDLPVAFRILRDTAEAQGCRSRSTGRDGRRAPTPTRSTSRGTASRRRSSRCRTATCIPRTRW